MRAASEADTKTAKAPTRTVLDTIERIGNSVPHPVVIFLLLIAIAVIASHLPYLLDASVSYQVINPATHGAETVTTRANKSADLVFTPAIAKWAIFAPVFVPLFVQLAVDPAAVLGRIPRRRRPHQLDHAA